MEAAAESRNHTRSISVNFGHSAFSNAKLFRVALPLIDLLEKLGSLKYSDGTYGRYVGHPISGDACCGSRRPVRLDDDQQAVRA